MTDVNDQPFGRLELRLVVHVAETDWIQLLRACGEQFFSSGGVISYRYADVLETGASRPSASAKAEGITRSAQRPALAAPGGSLLVGRP